MSVKAELCRLGLDPQAIEARFRRIEERLAELAGETLGYEALKGASDAFAAARAEAPSARGADEDLPECAALPPAKKARREALQ